MNEWKRVSKSEPCPICEKPDYCCVSYDLNLVNCMRVISDRECKSTMGGWMHPLGSESKPHVKIKKIKTARKLTTQEIMAQYNQWNDERNGELAEELGVSIGSLGVLGVRHDGIAFNFPMRDGIGNIIGMRTRFADGTKKAMLDTRSGIFIPRFLIDRELYICEGPSDVMATYDLGLDCIGRPSCLGGTEHIIKYLQGRRRMPVVVISDNDKPKRRPDGSRWLPGLVGAKKLFQDILPLTKSCCVIKPPKNPDIRAWYNAGGTKEDVLRIVKNTRKIYP